LYNGEKPLINSLPVSFILHANDSLKGFRLIKYYMNHFFLFVIKYLWIVKNLYGVLLGDIKQSQLAIHLGTCRPCDRVVCTKTDPISRQGEQDRQ
jgi:hypothetical protein